MSDIDPNVPVEPAAPVAPVAGTFTQEQVSAIAAKEAKAARAKAQSDLLASFGVESADDVKAALEGFKAHQESQKSAEQRVIELQAKLEAASGTAASAQAAVQAILDAEVASIPEDKRGVVPDFGDPGKTLAWIAGNRALIGTTAAAPVVNVGTGAAPAAQGQTSTVSFKEFSEMNPPQRMAFYTDFPEQAATYNQRWLESITG